MRKSLTFVLLLLLVATGSFGYIHGSVDASKDAVVIDETVLYGDKSMAEGLVVDISVDCDNRLFWDTRYTVGEKPEISTTFTFSQTQRQPEQTGPTFHIGLDGTFHGWGASGSNLDLRAETYPLPVRDVAARTKPGENRTETVYVKDYYDFYPISVGFERPPGFAVNEDTNNLFADYFKFPIHPEHQVEINIEKNAAGSVCSIGLSSVQGTNVYSHTISTVTTSHCFFTFTCFTEEGQLLDTSHIPGGCGVYRFPRHTESGVHILTADELQTVFPLDEQARVVSLETSQDESKLLLVTSEDEDYMLTVIDATTLVELQKLRIMRADTESSGPWVPMLRNFYIYEDYIVPVSSDNRFVVLALNAEGDYEVQFEASLSEIEGHESAFSSELGTSYNGKELAVAAFHYNYSRPRSICSFYLAVYADAGLAYAGRYQHSLDKSLMDDYSLICRPLDGAPPRVMWKGASIR